MELSEQIRRICDIAVDGSCNEDEIGGCPFPKEDDKCGLCFTIQILKFTDQQYEPVELEALTDKGIIIAVCGDCPFEGRFTDEDCRACRRQLKAAAQATIAHNEAKFGKLYRRI